MSEDLREASETAYAEALISVHRPVLLKGLPGPIYRLGYIDGVNRARADASAELLRLRARVAVDAGDVARAGITSSMRLTWLSKRCKASAGPTGGATTWSRGGVEIAMTWNDAIDDGVQLGETARLINNVAPRFNLTPWAMLEQLAAEGS